MSDDDTDVIVNGVGGVLAILWLVPGLILEGWVCSILWRWYAVPFGLPPIGIAWAIGLATLAGTFKHLPPKDERGIWELLVMVVLRPFFALGFGAIIHCFM